MTAKQKTKAKNMAQAQPAQARPAQTQQGIGRVFLDAVMANYPKHNEARQQLAEFAQNKDALIAAEPDETKRRQLFEEGRREYAEHEREIMAPIFQEVSNTIAEVAKANNLSAVYNVGAILYGGTDITDEVIKALNK